MAVRRRSNRKPKTVEEPTGPLTREALDKLWTNIEPRQWLAALNEVAPHNLWQFRGRDITGLCPYHNEKTPSFNISFSRKRAHCFGAGCGKTVEDLVALFAHLRKQDYNNTLIWLSTRFNLAEVIGPDINELANYRKLQEMKKEAAVAFNRLLEDVMRDNPDYLAYLRPGLFYLTIGRQLPREGLTSLPVAVFPKPEHAKKYINPAYHDVYDQYFNVWNTTTHYGDIIFHYNDALTSISTFKVRVHDPKGCEEIIRLVDAGEATPANIRPLWSKNFAFTKDEYTHGMGVFGLHHYARLIGNEAAEAYLTEGEFDVLSMMAAQRESHSEDIITLCASGTGGVGKIAFLTRFGIRSVFIVQDSPAKNGDNVALQILKAPENHTRDINGRQLMFKVFQWPRDLLGDDLDEAIHSNSFVRINEVLYLQRSSTFISPLRWFFNRCDRNIQQVDDIYVSQLAAVVGTGEDAQKQRDEIKITRQQSVISAITAEIENIQNPSDRDAFISHYTVKENIDFSKLACRSQVYQLNTVKGACALIQEALNRIVTQAYYIRDNKDVRQTYLWSKELRELILLPNNDDKLTLMLDTIVGKSAVNWLIDLFGDDKNTVLREGITPDMGDLAAHRKLWANGASLLHQVFSNMAHECGNGATMNVRGQGIHHFDLSRALQNQGIVYIVNGSRLFRGMYNSGTELTVEWEQIDNTVDNNTLFLLNSKDTWSHIEDVSDLTRAASIDLKHLYWDVKTIVDGWKFKHHEVVSKYLAAYIMSVPIQAAVGQVTVHFVTGESNSGKTSLLHGLLGGYQTTGHDVPSILEPSKYMDDGTEAWIRQEMSGSTKLLCVDEAEIDEANSHSANVAAIQRMIYTIPMGGTIVTRGGQTADQRTEYKLRMPVIMAAIKMNKDPVFLSRVFVIETEHDPGHEPIDEYLNRMFGDPKGQANQSMGNTDATLDRIEQIRKDITVAFLPRLMQFIDERKKLHSKLLSIKFDDVVVTDRFIQSLLPALTAYYMVDPVGNDPTELFKQIVRDSRDRINSIQSANYSNSTLTAVLYSGFDIRTPTNTKLTGGRVSARELILAGEIGLLNSSGTGIFYDAEQGQIVIVWRMVRCTVLTQAHSPLANRSESELLNMVMTNHFVQHNVTQEELERIKKKFQLPEIHSTSDFTLLSANYLMQEDMQEEIRERVRKAEARATDESLAYLDEGLELHQGPIGEDPF